MPGMPHSGRCPGALGTWVFVVSVRLMGVGRPPSVLSRMAADAHWLAASDRVRPASPVLSCGGGAFATVDQEQAGGVRVPHGRCDPVPVPQNAGTNECCPNAIVGALASQLDGPLVCFGRHDTEVLGGEWAVAVCKAP